MLGMDQATQDELRLLRMRAYGPAADIDDDPAALQRLHELEGRARDAAVPVPAGGAAGSAGSGSSAGSAGSAASAVPAARPSAAGGVASGHAASADQATTGADAATDAAPAPTEDEVDAAPRRQPMSPRAKVAWAVSVAVGAVAIAVAALSTAVTTALDVFPVGSGGSHRVATLIPAEGVTWPEGFFQVSADDLGYDFYGLSLSRTSGSLYGGQTSVCLIAAATADIEGYTDVGGITGPVYYDCAAGGFPASLQFVVDKNAPDGLRGRFPADSALQFVVAGDTVIVYSDTE